MSAGLFREEVPYYSTLKRIRTACGWRGALTRYGAQVHQTTHDVSQRAVGVAFRIAA